MRQRTYINKIYGLAVRAGKEIIVRVATGRAVKYDLRLLFMRGKIADARRRLEASGVTYEAD